MRKGLEFSPRNPITAGWTGGAGGRQMENQMEKLPELGFNSGPQDPQPRTQPLHHTAGSESILFLIQKVILESSNRISYQHRG